MHGRLLGVQRITQEYPDIGKVAPNSIAYCSQRKVEAQSREETVRYDAPECMDEIESAISLNKP